MVYQFGAFELDSQTGELWTGGRSIRLPPQPCTALVYLLDRPGRLVSRDELRRALWSPETFVQFEGGLNSCIKQIRAALGETRAHPRYIETFARRGYRFSAAVTRTEHPKHILMTEIGHWAVPH